MPRTRKQKRKVSVVDPKIRLVEFRKSYKCAMKTCDANLKFCMSTLKSVLTTSRKLISPEIGNRLYDDVFRECLKSKENIVGESSITSTCNTECDAIEAHSSTPHYSPDLQDGMATLQVNCNGLSTDTTSKQVGFAEAPPSYRSDKWKTPAVNHADLGSSVVTPKAKPEDCVSVLRFPGQGEMAISMRGSPLLVSSHVTQNTVNVQVPLPDGRVLSIQPGAKFNLYEVPEIDVATRRQLMTITDHINSFIAMTDRAKHGRKD